MSMTLEQIADGVQAGAVEFAELGRPMSSDNMRKLSEAIFAHARKSQPKEGVNERLLDALKYYAKRELYISEWGNKERVLLDGGHRALQAISAAESAAVPSMELAALVRELLAMLETTEQSDMGRTFHPTTIQTCRCADAAKLDELMPKLKAAARKEGGK